MFSYVYHPNDVLVANNLDVNQLDYSNTVKAELQIPMDQIGRASCRERV